MIPHYTSILWFLGDLSRFSREKPGSPIPELVFDDVQVFHHDSGLGPTFSILLLLRLGLLNGFCLSLDHLDDVVAIGVDKFVLLRVSTMTGYGSSNIHRGR